MGNKEEIEEKIEIREECDYEKLNRDNGISCTPDNFCYLCERLTLTPEERAQ